MNRRVSDRVSTDAALELVATLAMENALSAGDNEVISKVEIAILKLRQSVGTRKKPLVFNPYDVRLPGLLRRQAE